MARVRINVSFDIPEGASREDCLMYVVGAVATFKGSLRPPGGHGDDDPGDPMFGLDYRSVSATTAITRNNKRRLLRCKAGD